MPQFFCAKLARGVVELDPDESAHARNSLRLEPGDPIRLFDGQGAIADGRVLGANEAPPGDLGRHPIANPLPAQRGEGRVRGNRDRATGPLRAEIESLEHIPPPARTLTLIVATPKGDRLDWMIEKCTELGVTKIVLAEFERSVVHPRETRIDKLNRIAREACKQCGRAWLPKIEVGAALSRALPTAGSMEKVARAALLVADLDSSAPLLGCWLTTRARQSSDVSVMIGPEGGFSDTERELLRHAMGQSVRLAANTLRIETAAVAVAAAFGAWLIDP